MNKPNEKPYKPRGATSRECDTKAALIVLCVVFILIIAAAV